MQNRHPQDRKSLISSASQIPKTEWNFASCPKDQLICCLHYELAIEIESWKKQIEKERSVFLGNTVVQFGYKRPATLFHQALVDPCLGWLRANKYWPKIPWLDIPEEDREKLCKKPNDYSWSALMADVSNLRGGTLGYQKLVEKIERGRKVTYVVFRLDWAKSDKVLSEYFKKWIHNFRAEKHAEKRGKAEPQEVLKKLGALRLLRKMKWKKAEVYTQERLPLKKQGDSSLYDGQRSWMRAEAAAKKAIAIFETTKSIDAVLLSQKSD